MTATPKRGIVDPWRIVTPTHPEPPKPIIGKIDVDEIDFDADLVEDGRYVFRATYGSISVVSKKLKIPADALVILVHCLGALPIKSDPEGICWGPEAPKAPMTKLEVDGVGLYFVNMSFDDGMRELIRMLADAKRTSSGAHILNQYGVMPLLH